MIRRIGFVVVCVLLALGGFTSSWAGVRWVQVDVAGLA